MVLGRAAPAPWRWISGTGRKVKVAWTSELLSGGSLVWYDVVLCALIKLGFDRVSVWVLRAAEWVDVLVTCLVFVNLP